MVANYCLGTMGVDFTARDTGSSTAFVSSKHTPGTIVDGSNGSKWMYVQASAAVGASDCVTVTKAFQATPCTTALVDGGDTIAFAAGTAFSQYDMGWVCLQTRGTGVTVNVGSAASTATSVYTSSTAGQLQTATSAANGTAQSKIEAMVLCSTGSATDVVAVNALFSFPHRS